MSLPPHNEQAEQEVLGAILFDPGAIAKVADQLEPADFYRGCHQLIYEAAVSLFKLGEHVDILYISEWLNDQGTLDAAGGRPYLMDLVMNITTAEGIRYHAKILKKLSLRRQVQTACLQMAEEAAERDDVLEMAQSKILELAQKADGGKEPPIETIIQIAVNRLEERIKSGVVVSGIPTGFPRLDEKIRGLNPSKLIILAARPSMGKTGLAMNIATNVAMQSQKPVLFFSLEMEPEDIMERTLISLAESADSISAIRHAAGQIPNHLRIIDRPNLSPVQLRAAITRHKLELKEIGLVVVDYLQLMSGKGNSTYERVSGISRELKLISREFKIPLLCLAQLSRETEKRQDKRPALGDLRDSGAIEQDADIVLFIYRDEYYNPSTDRKNIADIILAKNRGGPVGSVELLFRPSVVKFMNKGVAHAY